MIIKIRFTFLLLIFTTLLKAQSAVEVDKVVIEYPKHFSSVDELALRISNDFSSDFAKARAIFSWLAFNISYDVKLFLHPKPPKKIKYKTEVEKEQKEKQLNGKMISKVLRKRKAICSGYSELFNQIALKVGLESQVNIGDAKTKLYDIGRKRVRVNHAWNSVKIDGKWCLIDATWGAGYVNLKKEKFYRKFNELYFDAPPKQFFMEHYPKKGVWFDVVVDKNDFLKAPLIDDNILNGKYEIIEPKNGVIETCLNEKVNFKISNLNIDSDIQYSLKRKGEIGEITTKTQNEDSLEFEILIDRKIPRYLTLYVDGKSIATFKINIFKF